MAKLAVFIADDTSNVHIFNIGNLLDEIRLAKVLGYELPLEHRMTNNFYNQLKSIWPAEYFIESETDIYILQAKLRESFELRNLIRIGRFKNVKILE